MDSLRDESTAQMSLLPSRCRYDACDGPVVGWSITDKGSVCRRHNELEWGTALRRSDQQWLRRLGSLLERDGSVV